MEIRVDRGDAITRDPVGARRRRPEPDRRDDERRQDRRGDEAQLRVHDPERDADAEERDEVHEGVDEAVLEELRQRVDVGRHAGHDPARHLLLVVVDAEPLQVREHLDAQPVQHPLETRPITRLGPHQPPVDQRDDEEHDRRGPDRARHVRIVRDAAVDAVANEQRTGQRAERVERDEQHAGQQPAAVPADEAQELEVGRRTALGGDVDVRIGGRRPERVDLREQLGRGRERAAPSAGSADPAAASAAAAGDAHRRGRARRSCSFCDLRAADLLAVEAEPRRGRDAVRPARRLARLRSRRLLRRRRPAPTAASGRAGSAPTARRGCPRRAPRPDPSRRCDRRARATTAGAR